MSKTNTRRSNSGADADALHRDLSTAIIAYHERGARTLAMSAAERKTLGVLWYLKCATAGRLAETTGLTTGAITGIVDRLEKAGYARREPNPDDRRSVLIRPLKERELRRKIGPMFDSLSRAMAGLRKTYSATELSVIDNYLAAHHHSSTRRNGQAETGKVAAPGATGAPPIQ